MATALCTRSSALTAPKAMRRPTSRKVVTTKAFLKDAGEYFAQGFLKTFVVADDKMSREEWKGTGTPFTGKISHHESPRKPFKDGYTSKPKPQKRDAKKVVASDVAPSKGLEDEGILAYLSNAAARVVGHNFKGDPTEPKSYGMHTGWTGDRAKRNRNTKEGFHSKK